MMKQKTFTKTHMVLRSVLLVVISLILGFGIYSWNAKSLTGNVMPMPLGIGTAVVLSGSMEPELSVDDVIIVMARSEYEVGDNVVYQDGRSLVVHKIVEKDGDTVITQGAANNTPDEPIDASAIKGKVVFVIPSLGVVVTAIKSPIATVLLLGASVWLLILSYRRERESDAEKLDRIREEIERLKSMKNENE